jgi:hypothetical protein
MSCVAIHQNLDNFHCPRLVSSHITAYHRHRLVRRYAPQRSKASRLEAVVDDQNLAASDQSLFIDFSGHQPTLFLLVRVEIAVGCMFLPYTIRFGAHRYLSSIFHLIFSAVYLICPILHNCHIVHCAYFRY